MSCNLTILRAGMSLLQESKRLNVSVEVLQAATEITDPETKLSTAWSIQNLQSIVERCTAIGIATRQTSQDFPAHFEAAEKVSLEHDNRGTSGNLMAGEVRPPPQLRGTARQLQYRDGIEKSFWIPEGLFITPMANDSEDSACSVDEASVPPGVTTALHKLAVDERYLVTDGTGIVELDGQERHVQPYDVVLWPAGTPQRITNCGNELLRFWCICSPRFLPEDYAHIEDAIVPYEQIPEVASGWQSESFLNAEDERYIVIKGSGKLKVSNEKPRQIAAGDFLNIPAMQEYCFSNDAELPLLLRRYVSYRTDPF